MSKEHEDAFWPTALSTLAWNGSQRHEQHCRQGVVFLLKVSGHQWRKGPQDPFGHDPSIPGWPWIGGTHAWIEPTALALIALNATGKAGHARAQQAILMILDRQLPHGGWNYGNTLVFGQELHPMPESTGAALTGLASHVEEAIVARSLNYLEDQVHRLRTPISLGWGLLGLAAWNRWPSDSAALLERCLGNQARYGEYDTAALSLLMLGSQAGERDVNSNSVFSLHSSRNRVSAQ